MSCQRLFTKESEAVITVLQRYELISLNVVVLARVQILLEADFMH